ncbi:major facilitator superfamily domain-containing protein [Lipomyces tetrasporus]
MGDVEKAAAASQKSPAVSTTDDNLVDWDGPNDPTNPVNWPFRRRWLVTISVAAFSFISPTSTSMTAPALSSIGEDLNITSSFLLNLTLSSFILAYAFGPFAVAPLSEVYGRVKVLQVSNILYLFFNLGCGFAQNSAQLIVCRFFAGLGGSAPLVIGAGVLADCWRPEERGTAISLFTMVTLLGPTIGPIVGGFITQYSNWRWIFYSLTIADAVIQVFSFLVLRETYAPKLLGDKARALRAETGNDALYTKWEKGGRSMKIILRTALARPFIFLFTQPICQMLTLYVAYLYGLTYLMLTTFPSLWTGVYGESISIGGLNYLSLGIGYAIGTQGTARINDIIYRRLSAKSGTGAGQPEYRLPMLLVSAILVPIGLFWYGWSAEAQIQWIMPDIGAAIFGIGVRIGYQCCQVYVVDTYRTYAASAGAVLVFLRSLAGFGFPLFAPYMFDALGYGWGNSVLAFIAIFIGIPAPFILWKWGPTLRKRSRYQIL